jgi:hypothetical protein
MAEATNLLEYIKMTWNYRIMKRKCKETGEIYYALNEVFYLDDKKTPNMYSERDDIVAGSPEEIIEVLEMMLADAKKDAPILTEKDFKKK